MKGLTNKPWSLGHKVLDAKPVCEPREYPSTPKQALKSLLPLRIPHPCVNATSSTSVLPGHFPRHHQLVVTGYACHLSTTPLLTVMTGDLSLSKLTEFWIPQYTLNPCWLIQKCWCDESIPGKRQPGLNTPAPSMLTYTDTLTLVKLKTPAHFPGLRRTWLGGLTKH